MKKSVAGFGGPKGLDFDKQYFSSESIQIIANVCGLNLGETVNRGGRLMKREDALKAALEAHAQFYFGWHKPNEGRPTSRQLQEALGDIERTANTLLRRLGLSSESASSGAEEIPVAIRQLLEAQADRDGAAHREPGDIFDRPGAELLVQAVHAVEQVRKWAVAAGRATGSKPNDSGKRHEGAEALNRLIEGLTVQVWRDLLKQPLTLTYDADEPRKGAAAGSPVVKFVSTVLELLQITDSDGDLYSYDAIRARIQRLKTD